MSSPFLIKFVKGANKNKKRRKSTFWECYLWLVFLTNQVWRILIYLVLCHKTYVFILYCTSFCWTVQFFHRHIAGIDERPILNILHARSRLKLHSVCKKLWNFNIEAQARKMKKIGRKWGEPRNFVLLLVNM